MKIRLENVSKKFGKQWIINDFNFTFEPGKKYAITGANGCGKSTLLKVLAGILSPNKGAVIYQKNDLLILPEDAYKEISITAPYLELPEEFTLTELLFFHSSLKKMTVSDAELIKELQLDGDKEIRNFSSGMKQRLKLALAFYTQSSVLFLDEPTANFDSHWKNWYLEKMKSASNERLIIICSNEKDEFEFCDEKIQLQLK